MSEAQGGEIPTEWDSSKATLYRIDQLLKDCKLACTQRDYIAWCRHLECLKREAVVKMKPEMRKQAGELIKKCQDYIVATKGKFLTLKAQNIMTNRLDDAELYLRDFMNGKGMLMKDGKDTMTRFREG